MNKIILILIIVIAIILSPFAYYYGKLTYQNWNNSKIDYSCSADSDCAIKLQGCDTCGTTSLCMNQKSVSGICFFPGEALCLNYPPTGCKCIKNMCRNVFEFDRDCDSLNKKIKDVCYLTKSKATLDPTICDSIINSSIRAECTAFFS